ncbi:MAG: ABC transporter substrate-binding protein [Blautia sp.]|jgi:raffinose/stachyose/melibiose transport system substrate-binding protein
MKKWHLRMGLCGVFAAGLLACTGCGGNKEEAEVYIDDTKPETSITLFTQNESVSEAIEDCCKQKLAEKEDQNLVLYADSAAFYADEGLSYRELLLKRFTSGKADDLYLIPAEDVLDFDSKGYIYDLSGLDCVNNLSEDARMQSTFNGKIFSIPLSYTCFGLVWNVDMLEEYDLTVPHNLNEFWNVCETLKQNGILPYGANMDFALTVPAMCMGLNEIYRSLEPEKLLQELSDGKVPVSRYMEKGFAFLETMLDKGYMDAETLLNTLPMQEEEKAFFTEGKCAFYCALYRAKTFEDYPFEIEMTPFPALNDDWICVVGADQRLAVNPESKNLEAALSIVETLGREDALDSFAAGLGKISSSKNANAPDIPESTELIDCVRQGEQIPNQDFRIHFNMWDNVRELGVRLCKGESVETLMTEFDGIQQEEIAKYKN